MNFCSFFFKFVVCGLLGEKERERVRDWGGNIGADGIKKKLCLYNKQKQGHFVVWHDGLRQEFVYDVDTWCLLMFKNKIDR